VGKASCGNGNGCARVGVVRRAQREDQLLFAPARGLLVVGELPPDPTNEVVLVMQPRRGRFVAACCAAPEADPVREGARVPYLVVAETGPATLRFTLDPVALRRGGPMAAFPTWVKGGNPYAGHGPGAAGSPAARRGGPPAGIHAAGAPPRQGRRAQVLRHRAAAGACTSATARRTSEAARYRHLPAPRQRRNRAVIASRPAQGGARH